MAAKVKKASAALATRTAAIPPPNAMDNAGLIVAGSHSLNMSLKALAEALASEITPAQMSQTLDALRSAKSAMEALEDEAKKKITEVLLEQGTVVTDKGARTATLGGWKMAMKPWRTGYDPKKVEALLRAKDKDPGNYMAQKITYAIDEEKVGWALARKVVTRDELETCQYEIAWVVSTPTKAE